MSLGQCNIKYACSRYAAVWKLSNPLTIGLSRYYRSGTIGRCDCCLIVRQSPDAIVRWDYRPNPTKNCYYNRRHINWYSSICVTNHRKSAQTNRISRRKNYEAVWCNISIPNTNHAFTAKSSPIISHALLNSSAIGRFLRWHQTISNAGL